MKLINSKSFRAAFAATMKAAENETIYIPRKGGRLIMVTAVPAADRQQLLKILNNDKK